jgi:Ca-activated chloride channel family protein
MTQFAAPHWFGLLLILSVWIIWSLRSHRRGDGSFEISSLGIAGRVRSLRVRLAWIPGVLLALGFTLLTVALARPQEVHTFTSERRGIDIVVALDASGSMGAEDFRPDNRFKVAKRLIGEFISRRENDRIGVVTFGARAATRVPVTFDHRIAEMALERSEIGEHGDGTAIGHAIATAVNRLKTSKAESRVIILLTDGVNNSGSIEPVTAASIAAQLGIRIYTIGVGSQGAVPIPVRVQNPVTGQVEMVYRMMRADLDDEMLGQIADMTGGSYFRATDEKALEEVFRRIDELEKTSLDAPKVTTVRELYEAPLLIGLVLVVLGLMAGETVWMRLPA